MDKRDRHVRLARQKGRGRKDAAERTRQKGRGSAMDKARWTSAMDKRDGQARWTSAMDKRDGHVRLARLLACRHNARFLSPLSMVAILLGFDRS